jgi:alpha-glucosidase
MRQCHRGSLCIVLTGLAVACSSDTPAPSRTVALEIPAATAGEQAAAGTGALPGPDVTGQAPGGSAASESQTPGRLVGPGGAGDGAGAAAASDPGEATGEALDTPSSWALISPDRTVRATVQLADLAGTAGFPAGQRLYYTVEVGDGQAYTRVIEASPLGISRTDSGFVDGLALRAAGPVTRVDETYTLLTGKRLRPRNFANERVLSFANAAGGLVELDLRAYDDGFAFRYRFPEVDAASRTVEQELTGFHVPAGSRAWLLPYDAPGMYTPAYEGYWQHDLAAGTRSPTEPGWCFPALFRTPTGHWALLMDTNVGGSYFAAHLEPDAPELVYRLAFPEAGEANGVASVHPTSTLPWATPWRVVIAGNSQADIVNSTLATDLADPAVIADTTWIHPGRASWSWWSSDTSPTDYQAQVRFVNFARDMTWEYTLVDVGWDTMANGGDYRALTAYARSQNVSTLLWYNSGGPNNSVNLVPRDRLNEQGPRRAELQAISQAGVRGIKVDFFQSDAQAMMQYYQALMQDTAEARLLVNFHGATIPRGWQRTYPNLMTTEAVLGAETYKFDPLYPAEAARRNTILVFTRNVMASMDFTPVTFSDALYPHLTTFGHELALSVVFESGIQHFADSVTEYAALPAGPRAFLAQVPTTWDDTRYVQGSPGEWVVLARRKGNVWYVGGIGGDTTPRDLNVSLSFLGEGIFAANIITDGGNDNSFAEVQAAVTATELLPVSIRGRGGFVATLTPSN